MDLSEALAAAKPLRKLVPICLRGDLVAEFEAAEAQLVDLKRKENISAASLDDGEEQMVLAQRLEALTEQMKAESVPFVLQAVSRSEWVRLIAANPPRDGVEIDQRMGLNNDTFWPAVLRRCVVEPEVTPGQWTQLLESVLSSSQYEALTDAAWAVNRAEVSIPFSRSALLTLRPTERT
jgi:hypothetical protein